MATYPYLVSPYQGEDEAFEPEDFGDSEFDEQDEAARRPRRMRPPIRTPQRGNNLPMARPSGFATKIDLATTANKLDAKIGIVSTGLKALDGRARALDHEQGRLRSALSAEAKKREALVCQINSLQQMSMILPLLTTTKTVSTTLPGTTSAVDVVVDNDDTISRVMPMLLFSSAGTNCGGAPGAAAGMFGGGDNNSMMMLALAMAISKK